MKEGDLAGAKGLLSREPDLVHLKDTDQDTPIHLACIEGNDAMLASLTPSEKKGVSY